MKVTTDRFLCVGSGQCVNAAPEIFDQDDDGLSVVLNPSPSESELDDVRYAADLCPARAISVVDG